MYCSLEFYKLAQRHDVPIGGEGYEKIGQLATKLGTMQVQAEWELLSYLKAVQKAQ